jgi:hypothetical protein
MPRSGAVIITEILSGSQPTIFIGPSGSAHLTITLGGYLRDPQFRVSRFRVFDLTSDSRVMWVSE